MNKRLIIAGFIAFEIGLTNGCACQHLVRTNVIDASGAVSTALARCGCAAVPALPQHVHYHKKDRLPMNWPPFSDLVKKTSTAILSERAANPAPTPD
jgi:hypothetical protein